MKIAKLFLTLNLGLALSACTFDKKDVNDAQDKEEGRQIQRESDKLQFALGGYSGLLTVGNDKYEIVMSLTETRIDKQPKISARIKRTDIITPDAVLTGDLTTDSLSLKAPDNSAADASFTLMIGQANGHQISGKLRDGNGEVGTYIVHKDTTIPTNLNLMGFCHPFLKNLRERAYEVSGIYTGAVMPDPTSRVPFEVTLDVHPSSDVGGTLQAEYSDNQGAVQRTVLVVSYIPYLNRDSNNFGRVLASGKTRQGAPIELDVRRVSRDNLRGKININGVSQNVTLHREKSYSPTDDCK